MGIYDRDYTRQTFDRGRIPGMGIVLPPLTPAVKWILIINVVVFVVQQIFGDGFMTLWFSVWPKTVPMALQLWRLVTYQFLHGGFFHLFFNMLVVYFFGPLLERTWGSRRFVIFYVTCGAAGGIVYPLLVFAHVLEPLPMVGASGAIYGMLAAGAVLFPQIRVLFMFVFPMSLRTLAIVLLVISIMSFAGGRNAGGEAAHLSGMAAGLVYVLWWPRLMGRVKMSRKGGWERKVEEQRRFEAEVDRILDKVHASGIKSLTYHEKRVLKEATHREQG